MDDWSLGYLADVEYVGTFYGQLAPSVIDYVCLLNGVAPPSTGHQYAYCELGCGIGMTTTVLAAANPDAEYYGVDFNPAHIARARALADQGSLTNLTFLESGFEELVGTDSPELPMFDYITLHGVYSWVSASTRADVVRFIRKRLKPGGAVFVSYNAMPAWSLGVGVQRLLYEIGRRSNGDGEMRIEAAIQIAKRLASVGATFLAENPNLKKIVELLESGERRYLAHEYLNAGWRPMFFADVAQDLAEAKLDYVGSCEILENFQDLVMKAEQRDLIAELDDKILREMLKDYCTPRSLRRDVFVRGQRRLSPREQENQVGALQLMLMVPRTQAKFKMQVPMGEAAVNKEVYEPIFDALADGPKSLGELAAIDQVRDHSDAKPLEVASMLIGSAQALPIVAHERSSAAAKRLNYAISARSRDHDTRAREAFAMPLLGTGVEAGMIDRLCYAAIADGIDPKEDSLLPHVWEPIRDRGDAMVRDGKRLESESENLAVIGDMVRQFLDCRMPVLKLAGAL